MQDGKIDAENGVEHQPGNGWQYDRDYAKEYELEQIQTNRSEEQDEYSS